MANEKILNTRILLKTDTLEAWNSSTLPLKKGEIAIATVAATAGNGLTEPVCMIKIGEDGVKTFKDLPWNFYAKASDVIAEAKSADTLEAFVNSVIADAGIATDEAMQALAKRVTDSEGEIDTLQADLNTAETGLKARVTTAEEAIAALEELVGDTAVDAQIDAKIDALNLADTYAAKVHGHEIADVNGLADSIAAAKKAGTDANAALETYKTLNDAAVKVNSDAIAAIKNGETLDNFKEVEEALAGKQAAGNYSVVGHKHEIADVNGLSDAIADAKKAGTDAAAAAGQALTDAKAYTDTEMTRLVGDTKVSDQITTAITDLDLANTYDAKGAAADAQAAAVGHADSLNTAMNTRVEALEAIDHDHANKDVLAGITAEKVAAWDAAEQNAKDHADDLDEAMDARMQAVEAKLGTGEGGVDAQIAAAVAAEAKLRDDADKALQALIESNDADILALQGLVGDKKVDTAIADAVAAEAEIARAAEKANADAIKVISDDYLKASDKTELEGKITANANAIELLTNGVSAEEVDGVNDLIQYVKNHGTEVTGMKADIKANADAIGKATEGDTVGTGLYKRIEDAEAAIGTKATQADLNTLADRVTTVEDDLNTETTGLKARMTQAEADIDALEELVGDTSVDAQIDAKLKVDGVEKYALATALTEAVGQHNTDKAALEAEIAKKANDADLAAIAKTGSTDDLVMGAMTLVFDCGGASV